MSPAASSRWCPTPEQLMILEELYRSGVRTPNASQIQRITAHLSSYGKIEGKNVFYWFQNHKARDRQKLRKKLVKQLQQQHQQQQQVQCPHDLHQQRRIRQQDQSNHHLLLNYFNPVFIPPPVSSTSASHHHLPYHNYSPCFPPPQVGNEGAHTAKMIDHTWRVEIPPRIMEDPNMTMMRPICGHDWMMMMVMEDAGPPLSPFCNTGNPTRPLKTLELFPITATNLKEEFNPSSKHLSCLTPTN